MRELKTEELTFVAGGEGVCTSSDSGNSYSGVTNTSSFGNDLINLYEGAIAATSYIMERVALSFD